MPDRAFHIAESTTQVQLCVSAAVPDGSGPEFAGELKATVTRLFRVHAEDLRATCGQITDVEYCQCDMADLLDDWADQTEGASNGS